MKILDSARSFFDGVSNLIAWAPIIFRDRDWDHSFLLKILEFKFRRMKKCLGAARHIDSDVVARELTDCADACHRILLDDYASEEFLAHSLRWGDSVCPKCGEFACRCYPVQGEEGGTIAYELVTQYQNAHTPEEEKQARQEFHNIVWLEGQRMQADLIFICSTMKARLFSWWD
jgi:hypothetical protein